ncbi:MAG: ribose transport system permease protein [Ilumatobacter sp.]
MHVRDNALHSTGRLSVLNRLGNGLRATSRRLGPWKLVASVVIVVVAVVVFSPEFFQLRNLLNVSRQSSIVGVAAVGMTLVILTGGIDLSVGSTLAVSAVTVASVLNSGHSVLLAALAALGVGAAAGAVNGIGVAHLGIQPFVMTLATMVALRGVALRITDGGPRIFGSESALLDIFGSGDVMGLPGPFVAFLVLAALGWFVLRYTAFGRYLFAIGGSTEAARLSGVPIRATLVGAYMVSGALAGVAGFMTAARLSVGDPSGGGLLELDAIAAVVIGGTSLAGGVGGMIGTVVGALLLAAVSNVLNLAGVSPFDQFIVKGAIIVAAVLVGARAAKRKVNSSTDRDRAEPWWRTDRFRSDSQSTAATAVQRSQTEHSASGLEKYPINHELEREQL